MAQSNGKQHRGASDPLVISTQDLIDVLVPWREAWDKRHPVPPKTPNKYTEDNPFKSIPMNVTTGIQKLSDGSGLEVANIRRILRGESKWTSYAIADKLLMAADIHNDLTVYPNPQWSKEHWQEWYANQSCET